MKSIGEIYLDSSCFNNEASKINERIEINNNYSSVTDNSIKPKGRLSEKGEKTLDKIRQKLNEVFKDCHIQFKWDKYCGCSICPCSPGFRIKINKDLRSSEKYRFSLHINKNGKFEFNEPNYTFEIGSENIKKLKEMFS